LEEDIGEHREQSQSLNEALDPRKKKKERKGKERKEKRKGSPVLMKAFYFKFSE